MNPKLKERHTAVPFLLLKSKKNLRFRSIYTITGIQTITIDIKKKRGDAILIRVN